MRDVQENMIPKNKKKRSVWTKIGIAFLVILLIPVAIAGSLYLYTLLADFEYDDPQQVIAESEPMSFAERSSFDAANYTRTMKLNNADIYYLTAGMIPDLHYSDSLYINAYRIALEDSAVYVQGKAYGINVPIKVKVDAALEGGEIRVGILGAYLGKLNIPLPIRWAADKFGFELEYAFPASDIAALRDASSMSIRDGYLQLVYNVDESFVLDGFYAWSYLQPASLYIGEADQRIMLITDYKKHWGESGYVSGRLHDFMVKFSDNPEEFLDLWQWMLASAPENELIYYYDSDSYDEETVARFYPALTKDAVFELKKTLPYEKNYDSLRGFIMGIDKKFGEGKITIRNRQFIDTGTKAALSMSDLGKGDPKIAEFFPEGTETFAVVCEGTDAKQKIDKGKYGCGTAVKYPSGRCAIMCIRNAVLTVVEIPKEEYEALASGEKPRYVVQINIKG